MPPVYPQLYDKAWMIQRWVLDYRTSGEIAAELGCTVRSVTFAVDRFGLQRGSGKRGHRPYPINPALESKQQLAQLYTEHGSMMKVAQYLHCDLLAVRRAMDRHHIAYRPRILPIEREWFLDALTRGLTVKAMATELGCHRLTVRRALDRYELPRPIPYRGGLT